jgi:hypothetical protein
VGAFVGVLVIVISYALAILLFRAAGPRLPMVSRKVNNLRNGILITGLLPLFGFQLMWSLTYFFLYKSKTKGLVAGQARLDQVTPGFGQATPAARQPSTNQGTQKNNPFL